MYSRPSSIMAQAAVHYKAPHFAPLISAVCNRNRQLPPFYPEKMSSVLSWVLLVLHRSLVSQRISNLVASFLSNIRSIPVLMLVKIELKIHIGQRAHQEAWALKTDSVASTSSKSCRDANAWKCSLRLLCSPLLRISVGKMVHETGIVTGGPACFGS